MEHDAMNQALAASFSLGCAHCKGNYGQHM